MNRLLATLLSITYTLSPLVPICATDYLLWDNNTPATEEDLLQDPLLILRTADRGLEPEHALPLAWKRLAQCNFFHSTDSETTIPALREIETSTPQQHLNTINVQSHYTHFDHTKPTFQLAWSPPLEKIHWQISEKADFTSVISTLDVIQSPTNVIALSDLTETFLNSHQTYFFRARALTQYSHGAWSTPVSFTVNKPVAPTQVTLNDSKITWEGSTDSQTSYLIFGSNSIDFVPSIYTPYQIDVMLNDTVTAASNVDNCLGETTQTSWPIDKNYAFYRILTKAQGQVSIPSSLVFNYHIEASPQRDVLQIASKSLASSESIACRTPLPAAYTWMQETLASGHTKYVRNPQVKEEVWNLLQSYFLPENHPAKAKLDKIFSKYHVLASSGNFEKAGFNILKHRQNKLIVAKHPKIKGYLIKAFLDNEPNTEWEWWKKRIDGARVIQKGLDKHGYNSIMKVPKKWIYPLPPRAGAANEPGPQKQFVLVVEDMNLQSQGSIRKSFRTKVTRPLLNALFVMLTENLLIDSIFADNIPFSKDGRIAFVDTEHFNDTTQPVRLWIVASYLNREMHAYWDQILFHNRPLD